MKEKKNNILFSTFTSIGIAAILFVLIGVVFDMIYKGNFQITNYAFSKMAVATLAIGLGFGIPSVVYENDNIPFLVRVLMHMGIGCIVMTVATFLVGWISADKGPLTVMLTILGEIAFAFIIWLFFYAHYKKEAEEMSRRFKELNH